MNTKLVTELFKMRNDLNKMLPPQSNNENIGEKFDSVDCNVFTNEYLYSIMNDATS